MEAVIHTELSKINGKSHFRGLFTIFKSVYSYLKIDLNNVEFCGKSFRNGPGFCFCRSRGCRNSQNYKSSGNSQSSKATNLAVILNQIPQKSDSDGGWGRHPFFALESGRPDFWKIRSTLLLGPCTSN